MFDIGGVICALKNDIHAFQHQEDTIDFNPFLQELTIYETCDGQKIETQQDFDRFYSESLERKNCLFRGEGDAMWICRSTLLREYRDNVKLDFDMVNFVEGFEHYKKSHLEKKGNVIKRSTSLENQYTNNKQEIEVALQHFGYKTSLIDFTRDIKVALCFATHPHEGKKMQNAGYIKIIELENICNVTETQSNCFHFLVDSVQESDDELAKDALSRLIEDSKNNDDSTLWDETKGDILYIDPVKVKSKFLPKISNVRVEAQKGVLVHLGQYQAFSLEEVVKHLEKIGRNVVMRITLINVELVDYIISKIKERGMVYNDLFPDLKL